MKRVAVDGATSMLGIALINECIKNKVNVLALVRPNSLHDDRLPQSEYLSMLMCDLDDLNCIPDCLDACDVYYHFAWAGTSREGRVDPEVQTRNIQYTLDAVRLAKRLGCDLFVGAGSQAEYGRVGEIISPSTPANPDIAYGIAKYAAGRQSEILCNHLGMACVWGRVFSVYGIYDNDGTLIRHTIESLLQNQSPRLTSCEQQWDYLFCDDAGRAFYLIGERIRKNAVYCIGSGQCESLKKYVSEISLQVNSHICVQIGAIPYAPQQIMHLQADISSLAHDTGFAPTTDYKQGIAKTIEWCKKEII